MHSHVRCMIDFHRYVLRMVERPVLLSRVLSFASWEVLKSSSSGTNDTLDMYDADYSGEFGELSAGSLTTNSQSQPFNYASMKIFTVS
ncbi:hypothetical protein CEXT_617771 [Caerostris extrusa]|uniref:Uncharacterized protein n=1 Tax=Caerostris extrusa TaxID=172846 RepID=A0AAV4PLV3_CAEEX|nr:hypothetical protein CEXT_617771 [Caerostris extrusa]